MAEREALEKEIEELQNLIMDHKRVHGDAPSSSAQWFSSRCSQGRGRGSNQCYFQSYSGQHQPHTLRPTSHWRRTYSLNNNTTGGHGKAGSQFSDPNLNKTRQAKLVASGTCCYSLVGSQKPAGKGLAETQIYKNSTTPSHNASGSVASPESSRPPSNSANRTVLKLTRTKSGNVDLAKSASSVDSRQFGLERNIKLHAASQSASDLVSCSGTVSVSSSKEPSAFNKRQTLALSHMKSHVTSINLTNKTVIMAPSYTSAHPPAALACFSAASNLKHKNGAAAAQVSAACSSPKRSRFIWVKCEGTGTSQPKPAICPAMRPPSSSLASAGPTAVANIKQVIGSNKKPHRRPGLCQGTPKTSAYSWVASSCSMGTVAKAASLGKLPHKPPKALKLPCKMGKDGLEGAKKIAFAPLMAPKRAKAGGGSTASQVNHGSRYRWKAAPQSSSMGVCASTPKFSRKTSVYQWTARKQDRDSSPGPLSSGLQHSPSTASPSGGGVKLRNRAMINRKSSSSLTPERRSSLSMVTVSSRYSLRRRTHTPGKPPTSGRRGQAKALVSYGRHKLRLSFSSPTLAAWSPRTVRSPTYLRVIKTRYKIDTRRTHIQHHNPALTYRLKRIQSARNLLHSRVRTPPDRQWRGRDMRWIGGALYRVSANKLSRTHTTSTPSYRSAKWFSPHDVSSPSNVGRMSSTRHVASRAVQRSLAIIRQARQKKQQARHYCMYYNRFGKCNRGNACPYIHDPEKVAVCTRFLRGTCKQTDGTCPFSHKVSKEKMPVCSYFLKGICSNSSCPYSHVYVSHKAAVCQDFIRGYCPQGEKCKKKHTLVCPEFSSTGVCPRGSQCKLQHRQKDKRLRSSLSASPPKRARTRDMAKRTEAGSAEAAQATEGTECSGPAKLPSFISLSSSPDPPESSERPTCPPISGQEATGKKLHIKPRFSSLN
ncbi:zinc finger CCCH domain-containing protein 3 isoform X2 [Electrophorus electricus]|uniref:zinc finger CCCH domain-containing protein 3 isoform X2 n=1 Tax=Electrophorus electricus TaxID=8005 RepID=UPI0015CFEA1F|nr:zinc finger CCCH domain-containing protein 3 isoform X2 [Electrophorus electricus]